MVVFTYAKIINWKQFTTPCSVHRSQRCCFYLCKNNKLKAIHNLKSCATSQRIRCFYLCKNNKLKAIHNETIKKNYLPNVVFTYAKIINWKQFTTAVKNVSTYKWCFYLCKNTNLKAIHKINFIFEDLKKQKFSFLNWITTWT